MTISNTNSLFKSIVYNSDQGNANYYKIYYNYEVFRTYMRL